MLRTSVGLAVLSGIISLISFANQLVIARAFGVTIALDVYFRAVSLPTFVMGAVGGVFSYSMVPALIHDGANRGTPKKTATAYFLAFAGSALVVGVVGGLLVPFTIRLPGAPAFPSGMDGTAVTIARWAWWTTALSLVVAYLAALSNVAKRFFSPLAASSFVYLASIIGCLAFGKTLGVRVLAYASVAGYAAWCTILGLAVRREFEAIPPAQVWPEVAPFFRNVGWVFLAMLPFSAYVAIDAYWAPRVGGSVLSTLGYAQRLFVAIGTLVAAGPATVLQPRLASAVSEGRFVELRADLTRALRLTLAVTLPVALVASILRVPIVTLLFQRGAFDAQATARVASILPWILGGMVGNVCLIMTYKTLFALRDHRSAVVTGIAGLVVYFCLSGVLGHTWGLSGLGAANLLTWWSLFLLSWTRLSAQIPRAASMSGKGYAVPLIGSLAAAAASAFLGRTLLIDSGVGQGSMLLVRLAVIGTAVAAAFLLSTLVILPLDEIGALVRAIGVRRTHLAREGE